MPYYAATGGDPVAFMIGILSVIILLIISGIVINLKIKENKIKRILWIMLLIQVLIALIDNYITAFPLMGFDARAFEGLAWLSYENGINIGRGAYSYYILNPIYKLIQIRAAIIFEVLNILFSLLININIYEILKKLKINKKLLIFLIMLSAFSPISLIYRTGVLREAIIIMFISFSLKNFIYYCKDKKNIYMVKSLIQIGLGAIFHSGVIFITLGYFFSLFGTGKDKRFYQILIILFGVVGFILFKDILLEKVGGGDIETIIKANNHKSLKMAGSGYLQSVTTNSLGEIIVYLPLFIFYFLYSPTPDMFRGVIDIISFMLNSSIFIYLTIYGGYKFKKIRKKLTNQEQIIIKSLFISILFTIIVFSIGTRNAGTALRHRDKIVPLLMILFAIIKNREILIKEKKRYERTY